jgi:hypothetical protein
MALVNRELAVIGDDLLSTLLKEQAPKHIKDYDEYDDGRIKSNTKHCDYKELRIEYLSRLCLNLGWVFNFAWLPRGNTRPTEVPAAR